jgi:hypothetical protein
MISSWKQSNWKWKNGVLEIYLVEKNGQKVSSAIVVIQFSSSTAYILAKVTLTTNIHVYYACSTIF